MEYIIIDRNKADDYRFDTEEYSTREEAIKRADLLWNKYMTPRERCEREMYVIKSANPDEDAPDHFDGTPVWYAEPES